MLLLLFQTLFSHLGLRFAVVGHTTGTEDAIKATLSEYGGIIVSDRHSVVDYTVMPFTNTMMRITSTEVVTLLWIVSRS